MDIPALKQQARELEQQGNAGEALDVYRQVLDEVEAIGAIRQELPLLVKIGDLLAKFEDIDGAVSMYERAGGEYALQGAAQPVISLCAKILRADPEDTGAWLRLARRLLEAGYAEGARQVLIDYAQHGELEKTRAGLERLAGRPESDIRRLLDKAIASAEARLPPREPRPPRPAARTAPKEEPPAPLEEGPGLEEEPEDDLDLSGPPGKRLTVPVGALDAEPTPDLLETRPPEARTSGAFPGTSEEPAAPPDPSEELSSEPPELPGPRESRALEVFPTAEDLHEVTLPPPAVTLTPETLLPASPPSPPEPPPPEPPPPEAPPEPLGIDTSLAPPARGSEPALERPELPPEGESWQPKHLGARHEAPPPPPEPVTPPPRVSRPHPRPIQIPRGRPARRRPLHRSRQGLWFTIVIAVVGGATAVLIWRGVIRTEHLPRPFGERSTPTGAAGRTRRADSIMARDTAGFARARPPRTNPPVPPPAPAIVLPQVRVTLPPGVSIARPIYVVQGLQIETLTRDSAGGFTIVQRLPTGQRLVLVESPSDSAVAGEIGITGIPPDTVVGHTGMGGLVVILKAVLSEAAVVQMLQELVEIRP